MINSNILKLQRNLARQINEIESILESLPAGKLLCCYNSNHPKWYQSNGNAPIYISKKNTSLIQDLAARKYYTLLFEDLQMELLFVNRYIKRYNNINQKSSSLLEESSHFFQPLSAYFNKLPTELDSWIKEPFQQNSQYPEHLIHKTLAGHYVRSKSEVIISNMLYLHQIPYRYECMLQLGDAVFYPDFTIMHPKTKKIYYWEHFGLMDDPNYCNKTFEKLKFYGSHSILPTINLITTYETSSNPLDSDKIQQLIEEFFL